MNYSIFEYYCKFCNQEQFKSFLVCRARTLLSFETKFNILFAKIYILILNNSFIIHELVNLDFIQLFVYHINSMLTAKNSENNVRISTQIISLVESEYLYGFRLIGYDFSIRYRAVNIACIVLVHSLLYIRPAN